MKSKEKLELRGKSLFKFGHQHEDGFDTIPTTVTATLTTTGFSKNHLIKKVQRSAIRKQI